MGGEQNLFQEMLKYVLQGKLISHKAAFWFSPLTEYDAGGWEDGSAIKS